MIRRLTHSVARMLVPAGMAVASLPMAPAAEAGLPSETADAPPAIAPTSPSATTHPQQPAFDPIAERLKYMHDRLRITTAQEPLWADLARVMQDNAKAVAPLIKEHRQVTKNRTAVETLDIYKRLGEVQLEGLRNFLSAFGALYDKLSDQQKKIADVMFRTSPLSMVGGIPELPQDLVELPRSSPPTSGAYPPSLEPLPSPSAYYPPYPYSPYYPWVAGPLFGLGTSFFFPKPFLHPFHFHAGLPHAFRPFVGAASGFHR